MVFHVGMTYAEVQQEMLRKTLAYFDNDKTRTARTLGVSVRTIHNQLAREQRGARRAAPETGESGTTAHRRRNDDDLRALTA